VPGIIGKIIKNIPQSMAGQAADEIIGALEETAFSVTWWDSTGARESQIRLHATARSLDPLSNEAASRVEEALLRDLVRSLPPENPVLTEEAFQAIIELAPHSSLRALTELGQILQTAPAANATLQAQRTEARLALATAARNADGDPSAAPFLVQTDEVSEAAQTNTEAGWRAVNLWLGLSPSFEEGKHLALLLVESATREVVRAFGDWGQQLNQGQRTELLRGVLDLQVDGAEWARAIAPHGKTNYSTEFSHWPGLVPWHLVVKLWPTLRSPCSQPRQPDSVRWQFF
jgi:hypothetical protein